MNKTILIVVAHPDDEILGPGGTIAKHIAMGDKVNICIATQAYEPEWSKKYISTKIQEQETIDDFLKINARYNLDYLTVKLNTTPFGEFNIAVENIFKIVEPDIVYTHFEHDLNQDHGMVFNACMVSCRPPRHTSLYCFETITETEYSSRKFQPNYYVSLTEEQLELKCQAFEIYESEIRQHPNPRCRMGIWNKAMLRGMEVHNEYAESFIQIRRCWE